MNAIKTRSGLISYFRQKQEEAWPSVDSSALRYAILFLEQDEKELALMQSEVAELVALVRTYQGAFQEP